MRWDQQILQPCAKVPSESESEWKTETPTSHPHSPTFTSVLRYANMQHTSRRVQAFCPKSWKPSQNTSHHCEPQGDGCVNSGIMCYAYGFEEYFYLDFVLLKYSNSIYSWAVRPMNCVRLDNNFWVIQWSTSSLYFHNIGIFFFPFLWHILSWVNWSRQIWLVQADGRPPSLPKFSVF